VFWCGGVGVFWCWGVGVFWCGSAGVLSYGRIRVTEFYGTLVDMNKYLGVSVAAIII